MKHIIKVCFEDGDHLITRINGTKAEVARYYRGRIFELAEDRKVRAISVHFLGISQLQPSAAGRQTALANKISAAEHSAFPRGRWL